MLAAWAVNQKSQCPFNNPTQSTIKPPHIMARNKKLLAALQAHKGQDYKLEKQKKLHKQATRKKKSSSHVQISKFTDGPIGEAPVNDTKLEAERDSEGWESDESKNVVAVAVCWRISVGSLLPLTD